MYIPVWNTDFLASNNFFHTLLNSSGVFHRAGFFHSPKFFLSSRGFFHSLWFESLIFIQNSKIFKEMVRRFFTFSEKTIKFFIPHLNPCFSYRNVIVPFKRISQSLVPLGGEQYHSSLRLKGTMYITLRKRLQICNSPNVWSFKITYVRKEIFLTFRYLARRPFFEIYVCIIKSLHLFKSVLNAYHLWF